MEAACQLGYEDVLNNGDVILTKSDVGLVVVGIDLFIVLLLFALLAYYKSNQHQVAEDINESEITASDFTVELRNLPEMHMTLEE